MAGGLDKVTLLPGVILGIIIHDTSYEAVLIIGRRSKDASTAREKVVGRASWAAQQWGGILQI
ncbi:uncharacterized protein BJX67DRAFT_339918 [Aspergillus lucknowensis]|uniref:Uncharacterized protein n=1 Tax=Aspergillus lucknowensis TaxID=176173 RepID=A0ABR4M7P7_9EURO